MLDMECTVCPCDCEVVNCPIWLADKRRREIDSAWSEKQADELIEKLTKEEK